MSEENTKKLARIEALLEGLVEKIDNQHEEYSDWKGKIDRAIYGDGNGFKGMNVRLDRLEQSEQKRTRLYWVGVTALAALIVERAFILFMS